MNPIYGILAASVIILVATISGCSKQKELPVDDSSKEANVELTTDDGGEESNVELTLTDTYDKVRNGARLILNYNAPKQCLQRHCREYHSRNFETKSVSKFTCQTGKKNSAQQPPGDPGTR